MMPMTGAVICLAHMIKVEGACVADLDESSVNGNRWVKGLIAGVSLTLGVAVGASAYAIRDGSLAATISQTSNELNAHEHDYNIHQTNIEVTSTVRQVIDREIQPTLRDIKNQLDRIEATQRQR